MLDSIAVKRFKSLEDTGKIELSPFTVLFGPNAAGKSNFLDAIQILSRLASEKTLADALGGPVRGLPLESFTLPPEGLAGLLSKKGSPTFRLDSEFATGESLLRYAVEIGIRPASGALSVEDEFLATLAPKTREPKGEPSIQRVEGKIAIRRKDKPARPRVEKVGLGYTQLSDRRFSGMYYGAIERARDELASWRTYYLDPRVAMREQRTPQEVGDIGSLGEHLAPFLFRLREDQPKIFDGVRRTIRTLIPSVDDVGVDLDKKRGVLDVEIRQNGTPFSSRIVSEGTLRILALTCIALNPWGGNLVAFEEPENGVHPRRIELIAQMLHSLATDPKRPRQVIVTTHSPVFCGAVLRAARSQPEGERKSIAMYRVVREGRLTRLHQFAAAGPLFEDSDLAKNLTSATEDGIFEGLMLRGLLDE
jgi:predicted ATPase